MDVDDEYMNAAAAHAAFSIWSSQQRGCTAYYVMYSTRAT